MKTALVTGITGQDGFYLTNLLLKKGYKVVGVVRSLNSKNIFLNGAENKIQYVEWDMVDESAIRAAIEKFSPTEIYNLAAYATGIGMYDDPIQISEINGLAVLRLLEAIRKVNPEIRFCQASSREIFGEALESPLTETSNVNPRSPYGVAKLYADNMLKIYRQHYGLFCCSAILFNHESERRGLQYVTRKITFAAANIKLGIANELHLGSLSALRDWGFAGDYVMGMWMMLQQAKPEDYVFATGESHSVHEFCEIAFNRLGLNFSEYVKLDEQSYRVDESIPLVGSAAKAKLKLGWSPTISFKELVERMVNSDYSHLKDCL
ncbi:GDP-mannose 4,6-dehydratase [Polynucleobacter sp. AM-25C3]|uniref:GDP-mannose 4,6-dehydratase n=1 Tax=Polynucleobacter sp. AM-25C3 TaxID=1855569 RepID=UPI001C0BC642|nr:GDP-mannose 4,6-dehydratase [Polynucleobacter sp. AM-25C3]MBU3601783.1 GDP-mannose 4,6-dehydratase [Polynucleobacter sp. AM-25C3]